MNKYEEVFEDMIKGGVNYLNLDPWVGNYQQVLFEKLIGITGFHEYNGYKFFVKYTKGGGQGMGEYPPIKEVMMLHKF